MIAPADVKATLAWLALLHETVDHDDPNAILGASAGALDFFKGLAPETSDDYEAIGLAVDAIAAAQVRALCLLELHNDLGAGRENG